MMGAGLSEEVGRRWKKVGKEKEDGRGQVSRQVNNNRKIASHPSDQSWDENLEGTRILKVNGSNSAHYFGELFFSSESCSKYSHLNFTSIST